MACENGFSLLHSNWNSNITYKTMLEFPTVLWFARIILRFFDVCLSSNSTLIFSITFYNAQPGGLNWRNTSVLTSYAYTLKVFLSVVVFNNVVTKLNIGINAPIAIFSFFDKLIFINLIITCIRWQWNIKADSKLLFMFLSYSYRVIWTDGRKTRINVEVNRFLY